MGDCGLGAPVWLPWCSARVWDSYVDYCSGKYFGIILCMH